MGILRGWAVSHNVSMKHKSRIHYLVTDWNQLEDSKTAKTKRRALGIARRLKLQGHNDIEILQLIPASGGWILNRIHPSKF